MSRMDQNPNLRFRMHQRLSQSQKKGSLGTLKRTLDDLCSKIVRIERGGICEVHGKRCYRVGAAHILPKSMHLKLRYLRVNIILAGWYCSHKMTHIDSEDPQALAFKRAVVRKLGPNYRERLLIMERTQPEHNRIYLNILLRAFKLELSRLQEEQ